MKNSEAEHIYFCLQEHRFDTSFGSFPAQTTYSLCPRVTIGTIL